MKFLQKIIQNYKDYFKAYNKRLKQMNQVGTIEYYAKEINKNVTKNKRFPITSPGSYYHMTLPSGLKIECQAAKAPIDLYLHLDIYVYNNKICKTPYETAKAIFSLLDNNFYIALRHLISSNNMDSVYMYINWAGHHDFNKAFNIYAIFEMCENNNDKNLIEEYIKEIFPNTLLVK